MGSPPKKKKPGQNKSPNGRPKSNESHHRIEAKSYGLLSLWIFADFLVVFGHVSVAIWIFYFVLVIGLGLLTHHAVKGWPRNKKVFSWVYAVLCVSLPLVLFFLSKPTEEPKPYPHFVFLLHTANAPDNLVVLTNDSLDVSHFGEWSPTQLLSFAYLFVPRPLAQSNVTLVFEVSNAGPAAAVDGEVFFSISSNFGCIPYPGWVEDKVGNKVTYGNGTNDLESWSFSLPTLLPGDATEIPDLLLSQAPIFNFRVSDLNIGDFMIMARAIDSPAKGIKGRLLFMPFLTNEIYRPVVLTSVATNGMSALNFSTGEIRDMQKQ